MKVVGAAFGELTTFCCLVESYRPSLLLVDNSIMEEWERGGDTFHNFDWYYMEVIEHFQKLEKTWARYHISNFG